MRVCHVPEVQSVQKVVKCSPWLANPLGPMSPYRPSGSRGVWLVGQLSSSLDGAAGLSCANSAGLDVQEEGGCGVGRVCGWRRYSHPFPECLLWPNPTWCLCSQGWDGCWNFYVFPGEAEPLSRPHNIPLCTDALKTLLVRSKQDKVLFLPSVCWLLFFFFLPPNLNNFTGKGDTSYSFPGAGKVREKDMGIKI